MAPGKDQREKVSMLAFVLFFFFLLARFPSRSRFCVCVYVRAPLSRLLLLLLLLMLLLFAFVSAGSCGFLAVEEFMCVPLPPGRIFCGPIL